MTSTVEAITIPIDVGPLNGVGSFCLHAAKKLRRFSELYREGQSPAVEWDLRNVEPRHMSMAGLTTFLSTAYRLRQFTKKAPYVRLRWNPQTFSFWEDISLFKLASQHDIFTWPEAVSETSWFGYSNPNTELLMFEFTNDIPNRSHNIQYWKGWKDSVRQRFKDILLLRCGRLFRSNKNTYFPEKLKDQIAITSAELVVNSMLWGHSTAFVGLQRSRVGITVAVCDSGRGFHGSLYEQQSSKQSVYPENNLEALIIGSLINTREYGLRRVINTVIKNGGRALLSSFDAELHWKETLWLKAKEATFGEGEHPLDIKRLTQTVGRPVTGSPTLEDRENGFSRVWQYGLRGSRIAFEIPIRREDELT